MRRCHLAILAAAFVATPALAQDVDMATIKCKDFLASSKADIGNILIWLEGYYTKESDPPILHADKMAQDAKSLSNYCNAHGDDDIIKAAEAVMPVK
jgi:acid stress chaperone HdeB